MKVFPLRRQPPGAAARLRLRRIRAVPLLLATLLATLLLAGGAGAVENGRPAWIELDGVRLFRVWSSNDYSAEQRVAGINERLQRAANRKEPVTISVEERNNLPVLSIDGQFLLTVTGHDVPEGYPAALQARDWQEQIERAIGRSRREREPAHRRRMALMALGWLLAAALLHRLVGLLWHRSLGPRLVPAAEAEAGARGPSRSLRFLLRSSLLLVQLGIWLGALALISNSFPLTRTWSHRAVDALIGSVAAPFLRLGSKSYSLLDLVLLALLFLALGRAVAAAQRLLRTHVLEKTGIGLGAQEAIAFLVRYGLLLVGGLVLLQLWGLDLSSLAIFAGVLGVGVGVGLQGITKNFVSGLVVIFERPIQVGDFVEIGDLKGTVRRVNLRSTEVVTLDSISIIVPNSEFLESRVVNWSHGSSISRLHLPVGVAYGSDPRAVQAALVEACADHPDVLRQPAPRVFFIGFGDSSLDFELLVWISQPMRQYEILSDLHFRIEAQLRRRDLTIPFPQRDLHLRDGTLPITLPAQVGQALVALAERLAPPDTGSQRAGNDP
ncbi:MAG: mechanosensitive ion channel domain-containing protein [Synechococcaceae cyanobacterium]|nr:mechanosensitive ion channel domain-containing protein [Synechococcaceae cyanobacterium]